MISEPAKAPSRISETDRKPPSTPNSRNGKKISQFYASGADTVLSDLKSNRHLNIANKLYGI
jgi:hypothetical protein